MKIIMILGCLLIGTKYYSNNELAESMERGQKVYKTFCISCHMENGEGMSKVFPPLAKSDYLMADVDRSIRQVLYGATEPLTVNGETYQMPMTGFEALTNQEVADVLNYVRNSWENEGPIIKPEQVKAMRKQ